MGIGDEVIQIDLEVMGGWGCWLVLEEGCILGDELHEVVFQWVRLEAGFLVIGSSQIPGCFSGSTEVRATVGPSHGKPSGEDQLEWVSGLEAG